MATPPSMDLPIIDLDTYLLHKDSSECAKAASALITYGALILHDSRVLESDNDSFLDLLEDYFAQPEASLRRDERPQLGYQVGVTLENTEKPKCAVHEPCLEVIRRLRPSERPLDITSHQPDPKCRFFWRMGETPPYETLFPRLNAENVVPQREDLRRRWANTMDRWGSSMKNAVSTLSEMLAVGLHLPPRYFNDAAKYGPHLLAPTASDLTKHASKDTILAGFHTDLNFLTIHGLSRYPGLNIWARNTGNRLPVKMPPGNNLLVQAGKQLEHLTGGLIKAGYHEVAVTQDTFSAIEARKKDFPHRPLVRISSTLFWHLNLDFDLVPVPALAERAARLGEEQTVYLPVKVGHQVESELKDISLMT